MVWARQCDGRANPVHATTKLLAVGARRARSDESPRGPRADARAARELVGARSRARGRVIRRDGGRDCVTRQGLVRARDGRPGRRRGTRGALGVDVPATARVAYVPVGARGRARAPVYVLYERRRARHARGRAGTGQPAAILRLVETKPCLTIQRPSLSTRSKP